MCGWWRLEFAVQQQAVEAEKLTGDNIYKVLIYFEKLYAVMNEVERRQFIETLISEIQVYEDRQPNGQWLKSIKFKLPIIEEDMEVSLDDDKHVETCVLLGREFSGDVEYAYLDYEQRTGAPIKGGSTYSER